MRKIVQYTLLCEEEYKACYGITINGFRSNGQRQQNILIHYQKNLIYGVHPQTFSPSDIGILGIPTRPDAVGEIDFLCLFQ